MRGDIDARLRQESARRTVERARALARERARERDRQVAMLKQARAALVKAGLSIEAATIALVEIDHKRVPFVRIDYGGDQ